VVNFPTSEVVRWRRFLGLKSSRRVALVRDLAAVVVQPKRSHSRHEPPWRYGLALLRRDGTLITVISPLEPSLWNHAPDHFDPYEDELVELLDSDEYEPVELPDSPGPPSTDTFPVSPLGQLLAERLGLPFHQGAAQQVLKIIKTPVGCDISYSVSATDRPVDSKLGVALILLTLLSPFVVIALLIAWERWR
jgi:hypothetical protein